MTISDLDRRALALFEELVDLPAALRPGRLDAVAPPLRAAVEALLARDATAGAYLEEGPLDRRLPPRLGRYRILEELGRGGFGSVYRAEPVAGQPSYPVAIKVFARLGRPGMFENEVAIHGQLEHPAIARLLEVGTSGDFDWVAMELVEGEPISVYCDRRRLTVEARVDLLGPVLDAVEYAHSRLVVHRDLNPSNIIVSERGDPKVLDFGIAHTLDGRPADSWFTAWTLSSASPEQLRGERPAPGDDVYALGALLFFLATGRRAFPTAGLSRDQILALLVTEPPLASAAVRQRPEAAALRSTSPRRLAGRLAGDFDAVVATALAPAAGRRYRSVAALAADLHRWRHGYSPAVRPASWSRDAFLWARRHPALAASALLVLFGSSAIAVQSASLVQARDRATRERLAAEATTRLLIGSLGALDPTLRAGADPSAAEVLAAARAHLREQEALDPPTRARLFAALSDLQRQFGRFPEAVELLEEGLATSPALADADRAGLLELLAQVQVEAGSYADAVATARQAVALRTQLAPVADATHLAALSALAVALARDSQSLPDKLAQSEAAARAALAVRPPHPVAMPGETPEAATGRWLDPQVTLAYILRASGRPQEAVETAEAALAALADLPASDATRTAVLDETMSDRLALGHVDAAVSLASELVEIARRTWGEQHPEVGGALNNLAYALEAKGDLEAARFAYEEALEVFRVALAPDHLMIANVTSNLAHAVKDSDPARAEGLYREVRARLGASLPPENPYLPLADAFVAETLAAQGRYGEAFDLLPEVASPADVAGMDWIHTTVASIAAAAHDAAEARLRQLLGAADSGSRDAARRLEAAHARRRGALTPSRP